MNIGGNSYYKGDIPWGNYTPGSTVYSGTTTLASCVQTGGAVAVGLSGNYWYGTWNATYTCTISESIAIVSPDIVGAGATITAKGYNNKCVAGYTKVSVSVTASSVGAGNSLTTCKLYTDGQLTDSDDISSGMVTFYNIPIPFGTSHTFTVEVFQDNGASTTSPVAVPAILEYTPPKIVSMSSVRWSRGDNTGVADDGGTYVKCTPTYTRAMVGTTPLTTTCKISVSSYNGTTTDYTGATSLYLGSGNLQVDNSYNILYELYDGTFLTSTHSVKGVDILTIGGRGIDLIHTGSQYGVAIGTKATAGYFDSAYPIRVQTVNASGVVTAETEMKSALTDYSSGLTFTKTYASSTANFTSATCYKWGRMVQLTIRLSNVNSASAGATIWEGNITTSDLAEIMPCDSATSAGIMGSSNCGGLISPATGKINLWVKALHSYAASESVIITFTYLV